MKYTQALRRWLSTAIMALPIAAAAFPDKPIEWVVPYPAGGGSDVVARILSVPMSKTLGQPIIMNNKPGAGTNISADYAASCPRILTRAGRTAPPADRTARRPL